MVKEAKEGCLIVGNYCHDVLIKDDVVIAESLGGAASFISAVFDGLLISSNYISKVGPDFAYTVNHRPIITPLSKTTVFHAHFTTEDKRQRQDRILKRVTACDPVNPSDLPNSKFDYGLAVGVGGEILPETLERMIDICKVVFVDIQALIRVFDPVDGTVSLVHLNETGFWPLLKKIGFLKASAEEAPYVDVEEARKWCCVVVTKGKEGCTVYTKDDELTVSPFVATQVDPTGAGDSFLGGLVAGLVHGLEIPDAALLGNFFGSLTVGHIGLPKFDSQLIQRVKDEVLKRGLQRFGSHEKQEDEPNRLKPLDHEEFLAALSAAKVVPANSIKECKWDLHSSPGALEQPVCNGHRRIPLNPVCEESINSVDSKP
ncbi:inositol 3-kinase [Lycium barbarum]|uniref:inositol 3-kinase n=1 Tax=Lycium barbarum TaxID=112863 RepID=UPI00293E2789|nr:inositol 3-kinase [Lycium barbarum]